MSANERQGRTFSAQSTDGDTREYVATRKHRATTSIAAATAGTIALDPDWVIGALPCTVFGTKGGPRILDLSNIIY